MPKQKNWNKWEKLLRKNYKQQNLNKQTTFEFANTLTTFFELLSRFDKEDKLKEKKRL